MNGAMSDEFYRIKRLPPYVIAEVNAMRHAARQAGRDIIDLGMGNPDLPPPAHVIDKLCEVARKPDAHGYSASKGIPGLRRAQANYYGRRFGVEPGQGIGVAIEIVSDLLRRDAHTSTIRRAVGGGWAASGEA